MNPSWIIFSDSFNRRNRDRWTFRALDLLVASCVLLVAWPVMIVIALIIALDDGRPIVYKQHRVGLNGREFRVYKFRSMRKDAEAAGAAIWAKVEDPRVTRVGHWLRKLRLDELPQLINVLRGDMSIVGPRPERPEFVEGLTKTIPYYHERHYVKPGITGWAQLCYPYGASEKDALGKLEYDLYYIKNRSIIFYLIILLQTAEVVLWQKGSR
jgi:exopolysaccharide biosynthesis polyprenyl glycosylphosphotransferase